MWTLPTQLCCNKSIVNILGLFGKIEASQPIKITMCYGSGTVYIDRIYSGQTAPAILHMQQQAERRMQQGPGGRCVHVHSPYSSTFQREINVKWRGGRHIESATSNRKSDWFNRCAFTYLNYFHPDPTWNDGASGIFEERHSKQQQE